MMLIFNASPLIVLSKANWMDRICELSPTMVAPEPVADEIFACDDPGDPAVQWLNRRTEVIKSCENLSIPQTVAAWDLGAGESSVLTLAVSTSGGMAILDDLAARHCGAALGVQVVGTLGLVLLAKQKGVIDNVTGALKDVVEAGLFISPTIIEEIISAAGE